ncbi:MAG: 6-carboxytetrahydropterin synthase QueD [Firmicutes bacterium]|nr:6-carboxytetrahydropterin synthase QueD [Bacillota bacterium]
MYTLKTEASFDSAHFLAGYDGKCRNLHGHRWRVVIKASSPELIKEGQCRGMVMDFGDLKDALKKEVDRLDHSLIIEKGTLKEKTLEALREEDFKIFEFDFRPTAENFARYFFDRLKEAGVPVSEAAVYETPNNCAIYTEGGAE